MDLLLFIHWQISPEAFTIPVIDWPVRWYGILFVTGLVLSQYVMYHFFDREGKSRKYIDDLTLYIVIGTVLGARFGHVFFYDWPYYSQHPGEILMIWQGGLASHGGAIGILIALYLFCRKTKFSYLWMLDRLVVVVCLTSGFIRIGNLMNSEIIGIPTDVPWAFIFEQVDNLPRHPAQLYEAIFYFILMVILYLIWKYKRLTMPNGLIFGIFMVALWSFRFFIEFVKENQVEFEDQLVLNMGQWLSIPFALIGVVIIILALKGKTNNQKPNG